MSGDNATWDSETESYVFHSKYNIEKFKPIIKQHFTDGGLNNAHVLAGLCGVSHQTILQWLMPAHKNFRQEFKELVDGTTGLAAVVTDQWHRESANGSRKDANSRTLNRRAEKILGLKEQTHQEITHKTSKTTLEEIDGKIDQLECEIDNAQKSTGS